ncbi:LexA family protein [Gemella sanguinis]|uniref:Repressor LexA n=1 Tax=Gemella sanguinis TaxID=84135 RepID=A0A2N6SEH2_9BACL|nr:LexA family transcriptional regulator [Gemella sanguinis]PMC52348.1 repressor LexA [Gemella sanguinis]
MITPARIKSTRESLKLTKRELAKRIGVHESSINKYEKGLVDIPLSKITELARVLNVTESYLMGWEDDDKETPQAIKIPVLGTVAAGIPISAVEDILDYEEIPQSWQNQGEFFGLRIKGDSMKPDINDGDTVIVKQQSTANNGDVVIALVNGDDATCKKFEKLDNGIMLISNNSEYSPMYFSNEEVTTKPVVIVGRVVELRRKF